MGEHRFQGEVEEIGGRLAITVDGELYEVEVKQEDRVPTGTSASSPPDLIELEGKLAISRYGPGSSYLEGVRRSGALRQP